MLDARRRSCALTGLNLSANVLLYRATQANKGTGAAHTDERLARTQRMRAGGAHPTPLLSI